MKDDDYYPLIVVQPKRLIYELGIVNAKNSGRVREVSFKGKKTTPRRKRITLSKTKSLNS